MNQQAFLFSLSLINRKCLRHLRSIPRHIHVPAISRASSPASMSWLPPALTSLPTRTTSSAVWPSPNPIPVTRHPRHLLLSGLRFATTMSVMAALRPKLRRSCQQNGLPSSVGSSRRPQSLMAGCSSPGRINMCCMPSTPSVARLCGHTQQGDASTRRRPSGEVLFFSDPTTDMSTACAAGTVNSYGDIARVRLTAGLL